MINLSKDVLKVRFNNIDKYRKKLIKTARDKRKKIIGNSKNIKNIKEKYDNQSNFDFEKDYMEMADKEKNTIEKLKQRQKNQIEAEIEVKIKEKEIMREKTLKKRLEEQEKKKSKKAGSRRKKAKGYSRNARKSSK